MNKLNSKSQKNNVVNKSNKNFYTIDTIKKIRNKSYIGLLFFIISLSLYFTQNLMLQLLSLCGACIGWLIFSTNHSLIAIDKLKRVTSEEIEKIKNS